MLRVNQIKVKPGQEHKYIEQKLCQNLKIDKSQIRRFEIIKESIDARKKPEIYLSYTVDVELESKALEDKILRKNKGNQISLSNDVVYQFPKEGSKELKKRPVIVGMGPAGLFCGYYLALHGYKPLILERGADVDERTKDVEKFWTTGQLNTESNVQFGEGGAGTFSDGKINTLIKDKDGRNKEALKTLIRFGAPKRILYDYKPHIGTDILVDVVRNMREEIKALGGEVRFHAKVTDFIFEKDEISKVIVNSSEEIETNVVVLAIGHSARDTFETLYERKVPMDAKSFAVGLRVEHPQTHINMSQYGMENNEYLGAAPYKVTAQTSVNRGVYSFCMCPGGYVVNASSEEGRTVVNGMSYSKRDSANANSAIIVAVTPEDYGSNHPLAGVYFQRELEEKAYALGKGKIPVQEYGDFKARVESDSLPDDVNIAKDNYHFTNLPCTKGEYVYADVTRILPKECNKAFVEGMEHFGRIIKGFNDAHTLCLGVESRTSSPIRIHRDETLESAMKGLYPCGEGAGYAGGITSAAMDGMRVAEAIARTYKNPVN